VLWAEGYWVEPRDRVRLRLLGPDGGAILDQTFEIGERRQRWLGFAGERRPGERWPAGTYAGEVVLERRDASEAASFTIRRQVELVEP